MKKLLRNFLIEAGLLYILSQTVSGMAFTNGATSIFMTAIALTLAGFLIKPVINILLLPINLLTFGLFRWLANALTLYIVDLILPEFTILSFSFSGFSSSLFSIPAFQTANPFASYILFSLILSLAGSIIYWIVK